MHPLNIITNTTSGITILPLTTILITTIITATRLLHYLRQGSHVR